jgi:signal recognition particle subunit SRP54
MDGHAKGGGAIPLSVRYYLHLLHINSRPSVAATKTPIIFLGVGEHLHDLDRFAPQPFISKLLGLGDMQGLMEHMKDIATQNPDKQKEMVKKLEEGKLSIRDWREQISNVMNMFCCFSFCALYINHLLSLRTGSDFRRLPP